MTMSVYLDEMSIMETQEFISNFHLYFQEHGVNLIVALGLLVLGWVFLSLMAFVLRRHVFKKLKFNYYFETIAFSIDIERLIARLLFFIGLIYLFKITSQIANLTEVDNFFDHLLGVIGQLLIIVLKAINPLFIGLIAAWFTKKGILYLGEKFKLDERIGSKLDAGEAITFSFTKSLSEMGYGVIFLIFLPAILSGLGLSDMNQPFQSMIERALAFMPNFFGAVIILSLGWFVAKIIKEVITGLLQSLGIDSAFSRIHLEQATGGLKLSKLGGTLAYAMVLVLVFIEALKKLSLDTITQPIIEMLNQFFSAIPSLSYAVFLLFISYFVANIARQIVTQVLEGFGFNNILSKLGFEVSYTKISPAQVVGLIAFYAVMFLATIEALNQLGLEDISNIVRDVTVFSGQVIFGLVIFGIGLFIANLVTKTIQSSSVPNSNILALLARTGILILVGAMSLKRMGLADEIVNIAFGLILGSLALGIGIAFGLGGKDEAAQIVKDFRAKFK